MNDFLYYIFYPNPGQLTYGSATALAMFAVCGGLIVLSFAIKFWRRRQQGALTRKLTRAWSSITFWFGIVGLVLIVARIEKIQFVAMRFLWVLWILALAFAVFVQVRIYRSRHYEIIPRARATEDPRAKYMPGKRR